MVASKNMKYNNYIENYIENLLPVRDFNIDVPKKLWEWSLSKINDNISKFKFLDCGAGSGSFINYLKKNSLVDVAWGIEISKEFSDYANKKDRTVLNGDICNMHFLYDNYFDYTFSCHSLNMTSNFWKALEEMYRVTKRNGYMIVLVGIPGNPNKHYCMLEDDDLFIKFTNKHKPYLLHNGRWEHNERKQYPDWIYFIRKI